jgi:hypothetical protein
MAKTFLECANKIEGEETELWSQQFEMVLKKLESTAKPENPC